LTDSVDCILDTSVFVARDRGRPIQTALVPARLATSVVTVAELRLAVLNARDETRRARRLNTLEQALRVRPIPIDEVIAFQWAVLRAAVRGQGQHRINDLWIAATALALQVPVVTQDEGFLRLEKLGGPQAILV